MNTGLESASLATLHCKDHYTVGGIVQSGCQSSCGCMQCSHNCVVLNTEGQYESCHEHNGCVESTCENSN